MIREIRGNGGLLSDLGFTAYEVEQKTRIKLTWSGSDEWIITLSNYSLWRLFPLVS
jgi:hypothetical protein